MQMVNVMLKMIFRIYIMTNGKNEIVVDNIIKISFEILTD